MSAFCLPLPASRDGGEGDRTPDLVNAIHALSQLSYAPAHPRSPCGQTTYRRFRREPRNLPAGRNEVKQIGLAQTSEADILQRLLSHGRSSQAASFRRELDQTAKVMLRRVTRS